MSPCSSTTPGWRASWGDFSDARWLTAAREQIEVNVLGLLALTQAFAPILARNGGGAILNLSSVAGLVCFPALASYSVSKAAVHSLTQAMRAMLRANGTFVAAAYPGPIDTDMARDLPLEKTPPAVAARARLAGLEAGEEEIFPDPMARQIGAKFLRDPVGKFIEECSRKRYAGYLPGQGAHGAASA